MSRRLLILICLAAIIFSGCLGNKSESPSEAARPNESSAPAGTAKEESPSQAPSQAPLSVTVTSPRTGSVLSGDGTVKFDSEVKGGEEPYTYSWSSSLGGSFPKEGSFDQKISKLGSGEHIVILKVTDATGTSAQGTTSFRVI